MTQRPVQMIFENQKQLLQSKRENFDRGHAFIGQKIDSLIYIYNFFSYSTLNTFYNLRFIQTGQPNWSANLWLDIKKGKKYPQPMLWMETAETWE